MRTRRAVLQGGLAAGTLALGGCVENMLPEGIRNAGLNETSETPSSGTGSGPAGTTQTPDPTGLVVVSATGTNLDGKYVGTVSVTVEKADKTDRVDLRDVQVTWSDPSGEYRTVASSVQSSKVHGHFGILPVSNGASASNPVIDEPGERYRLVFDLGSDATDVDDPEPGVSGRPAFGQRPEAEWTITLRFETGTGATTETDFTVPAAVGGHDEVTLR